MEVCPSTGPVTTVCNASSITAAKAVAAAADLAIFVSFLPALLLHDGGVVGGWVGG
jgi:hypothetical protein